MRDALGAETELVKGGGGVFDVKVDGELIFSKHAENDRFPEPGEVVQRIHERLER